MGLYNSLHTQGIFQDIRRNTHNGRDLPVDITAFVVPGENKLHVALAASNPSPVQHAIAVEEIQTMSRPTIIDHVHKHGLVPEAVAHERIKSRAGKSLGISDDDGLSLSSDDLTIDLADPFTRSIFKVPVRGKYCTHLECFDLGIWLETRPPKTLAPAMACPHSESVKCGCDRKERISMVDVWDCPICGRDARPYSLQVDGFLFKVRQILERENKLNAKKLLVSPDGSWTTDGTVRIEGDNNDTDDDKSAMRKRLKTRESSRSCSAPDPPEVINLD
jgi:hypothetical protein